jgi:Tubulin like
MSNHLIVGLGGTGGKVIRNLRKAIYRDGKPSTAVAGSDAMNSSIDKVEQATPPGVKLDYLYVDSSSEHMGVSDPEWKVIGENVQLDKASHLLIEGSDLKSRLESIDSYPALKPWIGERKDWDSILNLGAGGAKVLGGQKRRLGRLLFASNAKSFQDRVVSKVSRLKSVGRTHSVTFHIVAGLAGGTGSGCLIDSIALIRSAYEDATQFPIILYVLLPDEHPNQGWNTGNYHANGYAALTELNALGVGQYLPYNLLGRNGERFAKLDAPFKICYLVTNQNSNNAEFTVDKEIPELMAQMLYQKLVAASQGTSKPIRRIVEWENKEISHEGKFRKGGSARCRLFASFGIKKISYPEDEIREYIGYLLSAQTLNQMLVNNWAQGYLGEPLELGVEGIVSDTTYQKTMNLDREVFYLERLFSTEEEEKDQKQWKPFVAEWKTYIERVSADLVTQEDNWLDSLKHKCEDREKKSFRDGRGVLDYFAWKQDRVVGYAKMIAGEIEAKLGSDLIDGRRSLTEIDLILNCLCSLLEKNRVIWKKQQEEDEASAARERLGWTENIQRFEDLGPLAKLLFPGTKTQIFETGKIGMTNYFILKTRMTATEFAFTFVEKVRQELMKAKTYVMETIAAFRSVARDCEKKANELKPEESTRHSKEVFLRLFNGDEVTRYMSALIGNREFQDMQARQARQAMAEKLMRGRSELRHLPSSKENGNLFDILAASSHSTLSTFDASTSHAEGGQTMPRRLLSVSIIDKLNERYRGNPDKMKEEIGKFMSEAGYLLRINEAQHQKRGPGNDFGDENKATSLIVMMPGADSDNDFVKELRRTFETSVAGTDVQFIDAGDTKRHEITILSFVQLFPLRYVSVLEKLKEKYDARLKDGNARQRLLEIHTEGTGDDFPALYTPPTRDIAGPTLLLALSLGTVRPKNAGTLKDAFVTDKDKDELGIGFEASLQKISTKVILEKVDELNSQRCREIQKDREKIDGVRNSLKTLATEIAAGDDDKSREMDRYQKLAEVEFDGFLNTKEGQEESA